MSNAKSIAKNIVPAEIESVAACSIAEEVGFEKGDKIVSINGIKPRDLIDYKLLIGEEEINIEILDKNGDNHIINIEKDIDEDLGIVFKEALFDGLKQCNNKCPFCFIDQQPPGKRKSLYLKDDDYRLSFLYGSYLTLTNLSSDDWTRIEEQRLSPLFVSVHATDPSLRVELLKNPNAGEIMHQLDWFLKRKLQVHCQIVVCPQINDGKALERTIKDLFTFHTGQWPAVVSVAIVPVGLTRFRPDKDGLRPVSPECAMNVIHQVEKLQNYFLKDSGSRFAWLSDEWYLLANQSLPILDSYENFPQKENGVGTIRSFLAAMDQATEKLPKQINSQKTCSWVVGKLVENELSKHCDRLNKVENLTIRLWGLPSPYWGQEQIVTGLITGQDLLNGLKNKDLGDELLLPSVMLREGQTIFLDDMTLQELTSSLNVSIRIVHDADDIVATALGSAE